MLAMSPAYLEERVRNFLAQITGKRKADNLQFEIINGQSAVGGGAAPTTHPPTTLIALSQSTLGVDALESALRNSSPPVIARISEDKVLLDLRTVMEDEEAELLEILTSV
jgi:L-seryl-tRNA(Ser) seleniumtransferase